MHQWANTRLTRDTTIREAMRIITQGALRIGLVCDNNDKLLGIVTDGDIRRGLLADAEMTDPASNVMNCRPQCANANHSKAQMLAMMRQFDITTLPIVDNQGKVLGLQTLKDLLAQPRFDNPVFIMAGGFGTRLRPLTEHCPKPMLMVGDKPLLAHLVERFVRQGFHNLYISTHFMPEMIRDYFGDGSNFGASITYVHEDQPLGTGGALGLLPKDLPALPLIMMNGDVLTKVDFVRLLKHHQQHDFDATMCVREYEYQIPFGVVESQGELITAMTEKPLHRYHVNTGIYVLSPKAIGAVQADTRIDMPTLLEERMGQGHKVGIYTTFDYWLDIGRVDDYRRAQVDIGVLGSD
ncbi:nucleotidyltransferase family protein [Gallaecimonas xiamenensis]|uniref:Mannose-1-phosphate guanyltransferase n=1 Tax=Gallaecimonas xiamenensis 3-C-1 TaxID=745411 RepID=K2JLY2_9GAMM|nr:nucleotidyltransferase family protein [Gallaecimonas xiamenensis]EKE75432.1 mannose-1-phosphate guanyltransferase [Gallaecimonas xiamenensis 3-C-1]